MNIITSIIFMHFGVGNILNFEDIIKLFKIFSLNFFSVLKRHQDNQIGIQL